MGSLIIQLKCDHELDPCVGVIRENAIGEACECIISNKARERFWDHLATDIEIGLAFGVISKSFCFEGSTLQIASKVKAPFEKSEQSVLFVNTIKIHKYMKYKRKKIAGLFRLLCVINVNHVNFLQRIIGKFCHSATSSNCIAVQPFISSGIATIEKCS